MSFSRTFAPTLRVGPYRSAADPLPEPTALERLVTRTRSRRPSRNVDSPSHPTEARRHARFDREDLTYWALAIAVIAIVLASYVTFFGYLWFAHRP